MTDPLSDMLSLLRVDSARSARLEARGAWSLQFNESHQVIFGGMTDGSFHLQLSGTTSPPMEIRAGDCYLLMRGQQHVIGSDLSTPSEDGRKLFDLAGRRGKVARCGKGNVNAVFTGGSFRLDDDSSGLLNFLPPVIHIAAGTVDRAPLRAAFQLIDAETGTNQPGTGAIAGSLANIVLVHMVRVYLKTTKRQPGWLGAMADDHIGAALSAVHKDYARHWTVEDLAASVGMSRTAFAVRFKKLVGVPPLEYLTQWRMAIARQQLKAGKTLAAVAENVGYASDTAFNAAFKRSTGQSPGRYRMLEPSPSTSAAK